MSDNSILAKDKRQLTLIYNSNFQFAKRVLAYLQGIEKELHLIDISKEKIGDTIWVEISESLSMSLGEVIETCNQTNSKDTATAKDFSTDDWLKKINNNPDLLIKPIAINKEDVKIITQEREALSFFNADSAGLEKSKIHKGKTVTSDSKDKKIV